MQTMGPDARLYLSKVSRLACVLLLGALASACGGAGSQSAAQTDRSVAIAPPFDVEDKFLGNIWSQPQLTGLLDHWDQITPENAGKWRNMEPERGQLQWEPLDRAYQLAKENDLPFRFHVLVWGNQQPAWIEDLPPAEQLAEIDRRMADVAARYPDVEFVEVVNEPIHDPPRKKDEDDQGAGDYIEALGGEGETGWDWILTAFRMARQHFPETPLMLNEYSVTNSEETTTRYLEIVDLLMQEGLIDIIGVQGHSFSTTVPAETTRANLDRLAATGLPIQVTEMDIDGLDDAEQLAEYQRIFPVFWEHPSVMGITMWGWRPGMWRTRQGAPLVRQDGTPRPAMEWLLEYTGRGASSSSHDHTR